MTIEIENQANTCAHLFSPSLSPSWPPQSIDSHCGNANFFLLFEGRIFECTEYLRLKIFLLKMQFIDNNKKNEIRKGAQHPNLMLSIAAARVMSRQPPPRH